MAYYRVSFNRSPQVEETIVLSDGSPFPVWDSMDVVEQVASHLQGPDTPMIQLARPGDMKERARIVMQLLDRFDIFFLQYVIEGTGVRRTVRQSARRCSFRK
ncbi:hypothetical protein [Duganella callida]|uniref:Uncharacterized protein n=1 Tax=Duganella callida TaxID=2561932 RepID=A0A4Y9S7D9_9BURK|nr:hypothetical protein [Duganella callida]TFW17431.1 hypothetical protein E4L98_20635 [Duganella callida]